MPRTHAITGIIFFLLILSSCSNQTNINISVDQSNKAENTQGQDEENPSTEDKTLDDKAVQQTFTVETDEITTDLKDGRFVRIQFQLEIDTEQGKEELINKKFQVENILLKEVTQKTSGQLDDVDELKEDVKKKVEQLMSEGHILDVHIKEKVVQ